MPPLVHDALRVLHPILHDEALSYATKGFLIYLYSLDGNDGRKIDLEASSMLNEAVQHGYLKKEQEKGNTDFHHYCLNKEKLL